MLLKTVLERVLYRPHRHVARLPFVNCSETCTLLPSARFQFRLGEKSFTGSVSIGADSMVACHFIFESNQGSVQVGERTFINGGTRLISRERIEIGSDVTIAWDCTIYDHNSHSLDWRDRADDIRQQTSDYRSGGNMILNKNWATVKSRPIVIRDKSWIGFGCVILGGVTIGEGAVVGAGSVVREDVPPWTVVCGNPAVVIKNLKS